MMKKISITLFIALTITSFVKAQNEIDALRYSQLNYYGTARFMGLGGAYGAIGADFSTLSINPAGIGLYRSSEFTFTPSLYKGETSSKYNSTQRNDYRYNFNVSNIGIVLNAETSNNNLSENKGWSNIQFGFGMNRINNFNNRMIVEGYNSETSLMTDYIDRANGYTPEDLFPFDTELAYETYILDTADNSTTYTSPLKNGDVLQRKTVTTKGNMSEIVLSFGGNYNDKLYLGATIGFPCIYYKENSTYEEIDENEKIDNIKQYKLNEEIKTIGQGVNLKLGIIYRANDYVRLGLALHTPTFFAMEDNYSRDMESELDQGPSTGIYSYSSPKGKYNYRIETPPRAIASLGFIIGKKGLISIDYEAVDLSESKLRSKDYNFFDENEAIRKKYTMQHNIRTGAEFNLNPITIRGGYTLSTSPFDHNINDATRNSYSFGIGLREQGYFFDITYVFTESSEDYYLYTPTLVNPVENDINTHNLIITLGVKF